MDRRIGIQLTTLLLIGSSAITARGQSWQPAPSFPDTTQGRTGCTGLDHNGTLYVIGGRPFSTDGDSNAAVHALAPDANKWVQAPWLEGPIVGQGAGVDALGRIIVFGGSDGIDPQGDLGQARVYNPTDGFQDSIAPRGMSAPPLNFATAVDSDHRIYSFGGGPAEAATPADTNSTYAERYDATIDNWETIAPLPLALAGAAAVYDGEGHILVIGGCDLAATTRLPIVLRYDIATDTWSDSKVAGLPAALSNARAVLGADDRVYVMGGQTGPIDGGQPQNAVHVLDPATGQWSRGPDMITPRHSFAAALGSDDCIYAMGGDSNGGGTWLVEKLYTPPCPEIVESPPSRDAWQHQPVTFSAGVQGGTPLQYRWQKNGEPLEDGPAAGGGTITGSQSATLIITDVNTQDTGDYQLIASNPCGSSTSGAATLTVRIPPDIPADWEVVNLHPAWANSSRADDVNGNQQVGSATTDVPPYGALDRPVLWTGTAATAIDLTPPGSVGGACTAVSEQFQVGWWWWPYQCYIGGQWQTCHTRQACAWSGSAGSYRNLQVSGWEYSVANDVEGDQPAGTITTDDAVGNTFAHAGRWTGESLTFQSLHPAGVSRSYVNAISQGRQYGFIHTPYPGPKVHAALWAGSADSFQDVHPDGATRSWINGAGDGQQVGMADVGSSHAGLWYDSAESFADLNPPEADNSVLHDAAGGLQVGSAALEGISQAGIWRGNADSFVSLHAALPPEFSGSSARAVSIADDGVISIVGYGSNSTTGRLEALLWRYDPFVPQDLDRDSDVDRNDHALFEQCASGPAVPTLGDCADRDFDRDNDVDHDDFGLFQRCFSGENVAPDPACTD